MRVADVMKTGVPTLSPNMTWKEAAKFLFANNCSALPVVDAQGTLVGILSEKDLFRGLFPKYNDWIRNPEAYLDFEKREQETVSETGGRTVREVMGTKLITAKPQTPLLKIGALMVARGVHQVPVVEKGHVVGMVQRGKIYTTLLRQYFGIERKK